MHWHRRVFTLRFPIRSCLSATVSQCNAKLNPVTIDHPTGRESSRIRADTCFSKEPTFQSTQNVNKSKSNPGRLYKHECGCMCCTCACVCLRSSGRLNNGKSSKVKNTCCHQWQSSENHPHNLSKCAVVLVCSPGYDGCPYVCARRRN